MSERKDLELIAEGIEENRAMLRFAREQGIRAQITISAAFGCPFEGEIPAATILRWCRRLQDEAGIHSINLCDTTGMAYPALVHELVGLVRRSYPAANLALHFHNTRGLGLANVFAGLDAGVIHFDAALAGIGGCPYAPGATGNICTEDLIHALEVSGYRCGVDLDALIAETVATVKPAAAANRIHFSGSFFAAVSPSRTAGPLTSIIPRVEPATTTGRFSNRAASMAVATWVLSPISIRKKAEAVVQKMAQKPR
mgnify:CR=1 FL=1